MSAAMVIEADLTYVDGGFAPAVRVTVGSDGRIDAVGSSADPVTHRLTGKALLPGFVNAHSHAFQRGLRGLGEHYPAGVGDFWTWREEMYALVQRLDAEAFTQLCRRAFDEMLRAGVTTVGEFHYLHHEDPGAADFRFDELVLAAAAEAGIRLVLLETYYRTGGFGQALEPGQRRFATASVPGFFEHVERLREAARPGTQHVGIAAHSIRAVPADDLVALLDGARQRGLVVHMHVEEQRKEIDASREALGTTPMAWLLEHGAIDRRFTAVHATHAEPAVLERFIERGGNVCLCPITEANLGDGLADVPRMLRRDDAVCVGSDSNVRIDMQEELRWLEYGQRLRDERRGVCRDGMGDVARRLLACGTVNGARALGIDAGAIAAGRLADFVAVDLRHPVLAGCDAETLAAGLVFGSGAEVVAGVCVGGEWVV